jgi:hypothetical protein
MLSIYRYESFNTLRRISRFFANFKMHLKDHDATDKAVSHNSERYTSKQKP